MNWLTTVSRAALLSAPLLSAPALVHAQVVVGFKVGPVFSHISTDALIISDALLTTVGGGLFVRFSVGRITLQPELLLLTKGAPLRGTSAEDRDLKIQYTEIPLLVRVEMTDDRFRPYLMAGPAFAFEYDCEIDIKFEGDDDHFECDEFDDELLNNLTGADIGLTAVLGAQYPLGPGTIFLEGRFTYGLTDIATDPLNTSMKNRSAAIYAGFSIPVHY